MLQTRTIDPGTLGLLKRLMSLNDPRQFYLVGGTSLALQMGHRVSVDLDLFTSEPFDKSGLLELLNTHFEEVTLESEGTSMLITNIEQVKVDFVKMGYPILFPTLEIEGVRMLEIKDIAPMKPKAIAQRGSKSLTYFEDAEQYADPKVFDETVTWKKVKSKILKAVQQLA